MARVLSLTRAERITPEVWVSLFRNVLLDPPKIHMVAGGNGKSVYVVNEDVRVRCCETLARANLSCLPWLAGQGVAEEELRGLLERMAEVFGENVRAKSNTGFIFESTIHTCVNLVNVLKLDEFQPAGGFGAARIREELKKGGVGDEIWGEGEVVSEGGEGAAKDEVRGGRPEGRGAQTAAATATTTTTRAPSASFDPMAPPLSNPQEMNGGVVTI